MSKWYTVPVKGTVWDFTSQASTTYAATNAIDGDIGTYWRCNSPTGAQITLMLQESAMISKVRLYFGDSSRMATEWKLSGSHDGVDFTDIYTGICETVTGWHDFQIEPAAAYQYIRWTCVTCASASRLYLYEINLMKKVPYTKADGKYIVVQFDKELVGDVSGLTPTPVGGWEASDEEAPIVSVTSSGDYSSSYPAKNALDGSTSSYWRSPNPVAGSYLVLDFEEAAVIGAFDIYQSTSYYPKAIKVSGSNDGSAYTEIGTIQNDGTEAGWKRFEFKNSAAYRYYKIEFTDYASSSRVYIYEIKALLAKPVGNEQAFDITGKVCTYAPDGELVDESFEVASVSRHETVENAILLEINDYDRFESVIGELTVSYTRARGNLSGAGVAVEDFAISFQPEGLVWKGDQHNAEHISVTASASGDLIRVYFSAVQDAEHVEVNLSAVGVLTHIDDI